ncbi:MAG: DUF445 domain-containing protein [Actinomycetia bacterium]|nr:DUF445 domain-containing protein [Actinomycetes bacterium]MCP3913567.1 DUF445 domain-containing protein [Actinomycetes bacterium]MCP4085888.1 DUF445 domain-containing protein [Actinomycetes bacterium]
MKLRATGLLLIAAVLFVVVRLLTDSDGWAGYVEAGAEAAMVGGLADWFAVTALFRHPLRLPIPHTAIIPKRKDELGRGLGSFVRDNFLSPEVVMERVTRAEPAARLGEWLSRPGSAERVADEAATVLLGVLDVLDDDEIQAGIEHAVVERVRGVPAAPLLGRSLELVLEGDRHHHLLDSVVKGVHHYLIDNEQQLRQRLYLESPRWVPQGIDDRVFDKINGVIGSLLIDIEGNPDHEMRQILDDRLSDLVVRLRNSPTMAARAEGLKEELIDHPAVRAWTGGLWSDLKAELVRAAGDPDSQLHRRFVAAGQSAGQRLVQDASTRAKVDHWIGAAAAHLVEQGGEEAADLISSTVERWDADETGRRIELQVGRDLQFIRINGTVVGALVGLIIHAVGELL